MADALMMRASYAVTGRPDGRRLGEEEAGGRRAGQPSIAPVGRWKAPWRGFQDHGSVHPLIVLAVLLVPWAQDRSALWNAAEAAEKRKDAKVAREYELALPSELDRGQRRDLVRAFAEDIRDRYGVAVDVAIHAPHDHGDDRNHHAHVMTTTRVVGLSTPVGFQASGAE